MVLRGRRVWKANRGGEDRHAGAEQLNELAVTEARGLPSGDGQMIVLGQIAGTGWPPHRVK